ncbi:MAG: MFS transporter [Verrucomicrobia bacterium]|nr:MFS transporter [Verrucomicrobiota bacterium]
MRNSTPKSTFVPLALVFFFQWGAAGMWNVPFSNVLRHAGLERFIAMGFACNAIAAFISPLLVGALADRGFSPLKLLRNLYWLSGATLGLTFLAIDRGWGGVAMLGCMQLHALCFSPLSSLVTTIALAKLSNPSQEFGPLRTWATFGWVAAGWVVSWVLLADSSPLCGYAAAGVLIFLGFITYSMPTVPLFSAGRARNWQEYLGLDALKLLSHPDHRTILLTVTLFGIPMAAFYPYTPLHLSALGFPHPTATMTLGQASEVVSLLLLAGLTRRIRLKWVILGGLLFGVLRYGLFAIDTRTALLVGIALHGACYTFYNVTAQMYLAERVETAMKARAQALFAMLTGGVSNLFGYLGSGWIFQMATTQAGTRWTLYWSILSVGAIAITLYFMRNYQGVGQGFFRSATVASANTTRAQSGDAAS